MADRVDRVSPPLCDTKLFSKEIQFKIQLGHATYEGTDSIVLDIDIET